PTFIFVVTSALKKNNEVIIVLPQFEGFIIAVLAKLLRKKIIVFYVCEVTLSNKIIPKFFEFLLRFSHSLTVYLADNIVTLTVDFAKNNALLNKKINKINAILPVINDPKDLRGINSRFIKQLPKGKKIIGFVGRVSSEKGIEYLLETIPILRKKWGNNFVILIAGSLGVGESEYHQMIKTQINKYKKFIRWLQKLEDGELEAFYKSLDVLILPSVNPTEAFGMVQVEAMLSGTPVIASNLPGVRMPIKWTGMGEVVPLRDSEILAQTIIKVVKNKKNYQQNLSEIKSIFDKQKILNQWQKLLN
ncbi:MAG TPA: glycosyltransferase family 4 protein, partial [Patescibacteria group bacterium]